MNITKVKRYYITEMILLSSDILATNLLFTQSAVALFIYSPFYALKMIDSTGKQLFMNVFAKFR